MHAMAGTPDGVMNHTVSGTGWRNLSFNGTVVGETGINAALCGTWGCPVLMVTGDSATCREAHGAARRRPDDGRGEAGAGPLQRPPHLAAAGARADRGRQPRRRCPTSGAVPPYDPGKPCEITVELATSEEVERYRHHAVVEIVDGRTLVSRADDWWTAWRQFYFTFFRDID